MQVILIENGVFVGLWWTDLSLNAPNNLLKASIILCLQICFSLFSPFLLMIYYSIHRRITPYCNYTLAINEINSDALQQQESQVNLIPNPEEIQHRQATRPPSVAQIDGSTRNDEEEQNQESASSTPKFRTWNAFFIIFSCILYMNTTASDINLAGKYYSRARDSIDNHHWYFGWTVWFLVAPPIFTTLMSLWNLSRQKHQSSGRDSTELPDYVRGASVTYNALLLSRLGRSAIIITQIDIYNWLYCFIL